MKSLGTRRNHTVCAGVTFSAVKSCVEAVEEDIVGTCSRATEGPLRNESIVAIKARPRLSHKDTAFYEFVEREDTFTALPQAIRTPLLRRRPLGAHPIVLNPSLIYSSRVRTPRCSRHYRGNRCLIVQNNQHAFSET